MCVCVELYSKHFIFTFMVSRTSLIGIEWYIKNTDRFSSGQKIYL